jgi:hypothetical protein
MRNIYSERDISFPFWEEFEFVVFGEPGTFASHRVTGMGAGASVTD